jgi:hypothetical protein
MTYWPVVFLAGFQLAFLVSYASVIYQYQSAQTKHLSYLSPGFVDRGTRMLL